MSRALLLVFITSALYSANVFCCSMSEDNDWYMEKDKLIKAEKLIVIGKLKDEKKLPSMFDLTSYHFEVLKTLKGDKAKKSVIIKANPAPQNRNSYLVELGKNCNPIVNFKKGKSYILFVNKINPMSYMEFPNYELEWYKYILKHIK